MQIKGTMNMKTLTKEQAEAVYAFMECFDLHSTGAWAPIERAMIEDFGIVDPEDILEEAKMALQ
tara:strand:+ start:1142 stop:1333 length:192 start_codon:yes stop_codon:yes gene_type:complete